MHSVLFYVWEDSKVCANWNHSFDVHLNYAEPVSCVLPAWNPSGCTVVSGCNVWGLGHQQLVSFHPEFPQGSPSGDTVAWWLQHPFFTDTEGNIFHSQYFIYLILCIYLFIQFYLEISWDNKLLKNSIQEISPIKSAWWFSQEKTVALSILIASNSLSFFILL